MFDWFRQLSAEFLTQGARIGLVAALAIAALWLTGRLADRVDAWTRRQGELSPTEGEKRLRTASNVVRYTLSVLIVVAAGSMTLHQLGVDMAPVLAGLSVTTLVVGFGAQNLIRDYLSGFFMLVENQYAVDDWIQIGGVNGRVERITLRITQLRDVDGNVHFVPNGEVRVATNLTKEWSRAVLDISVAYAEDTDRVVEVLEQIGREFEADSEWGHRLLEPLRVPGVQELGDSGVKVRMVYKTLPESRWDVTRELRRRVKKRFDSLGIEIPFPQRTIHLRDQREGPLP